jgi:hypothetical protein
MGTMIAMMLPATIGFGSLAVDGSYYTYRELLPRQAVQAAALAAGNKLPTYYSSGTGSTTSIASMAQAFITNNMPVAQYGTITPTTVVGNWVSNTLALEHDCFRLTRTLPPERS